MKRARAVVFLTSVALSSLLSTLAVAQDHGATPDQQPPAPVLAPAQAAPPGGGGGIRFGGIVAYPDRPKAPQEMIDRGKAQYSVACAFCHASDAGGAVGPNLIRSGVVLEDQNGEKIGPIVHGSRVDKGMPRIDLTDAQIADIAAWLHSLKVSSRSGPPDKPINIVVGDAAKGQSAFQATCSSCHSTTGDLAGIASKIRDPRVLQQTWLLPAGPGARLGAATALDSPIKVKPVTATVTLPSGQLAEGEVAYVDDFNITLKSADGSEHTYVRNGNVPKVEIHDPMAPHRALFSKYTDQTIHDITAYLVTIK